MFKTIEAINTENPALTSDGLAEALRTRTGLSIRECREWVKAWILK